MGRPSKYKPEFAEQAFKLCFRMGATDEDLADFFNVDVATISRWKLAEPLFREALKGKDGADGNVEVSLYRRAIGYSHADVHVSSFEGKITVTPLTKHYAPDTTACIFWLKNRRKAEWRDVNRTELTDPDGNNPFAGLMEMIAANGRPRPPSGS